MRKQFVFTALIVAMILLTLLPVRPALAAYEHGDVALEPISGSDCDSTTFEYRGHTIAEGFAVSISADLPCETYTQIKFGSAVAGLGESWEEQEWFLGQLVWWAEYNPYVKEMWVKVEGDSHYTAIEDAIFDNTGTGEHSWEFLRAVLEAIGLIFTGVDIYEWISEVYAEPPVAEWQEGLHWSKAISRQGGWVNLPPTYVPWLDPDLPRLQTAGANTLSTFVQDGPNTLTVTAQAEIYVQVHDLLNGGVVKTYIGTYSVGFQVSVPVGVYNLEVRTYLTTGAAIYDVEVWIDDDPVRYSWVAAEVGYGTHSVEVRSSFTVGYYRYTFKYWEGGSTSNPRTVNVVSDITLRAYYERTMLGGPGGCPYVSTWNGTYFVLDNNLMPEAEYSNGNDVVDHYKLQQPLTLANGGYSLLVWDLDKHSFLDQVQLMAIDHESDTNIAVTPCGQILTFRDPIPPTTAVDNHGNQILDLLKAQDGQYHEGYSGDYIQLDFSGADIQNRAKLVITSDYCFLPPCAIVKSPVHIQIQNSPETWQTVATIYPRIYWATDIIDVSKYLPDADGELRIRIAYTGQDRIDFIGLDTSKQGEFEAHYATLVTATHSTRGDVKDVLMHSDNTYAELMPGEEIALKFTVPRSKEEVRDLIIVVEGHYFTIPA